MVIIGNGIAGITAARHIRKRTDHRITVISGETDHFFSRTALMYIYMGHMTFENTQPYEPYFWKKNRIDLVRDWVTSVDPQSKKLSLQQKGSMDYDILILATGSTPNKFGWPGQDLRGAQAPPLRPSAGTAASVAASPAAAERPRGRCRRPAGAGGG